MELNETQTRFLFIIQLVINDIDETFDIQLEEDEDITERRIIFEQMINQSTEEFINQSIITGTNINAYEGLNSRFINFIRGAIIPENENDEQNLDKINEKLIELEKLDKNNVPKIIKIFAKLINYISSLSTEAKNDMLRSFIEQNTLEEKMNETFPQIGTIMFYSATLKDNKTLFSEKDIKILSEISKNIKLINKKKYSGLLTKSMIVNNLHNSLFEASPYVQEIFLQIVKNNPQFFENIKKETGIDFNETINKYKLPIENKIYKF